MRLIDLFRWLFVGAFMRLHFGGDSKSEQKSSTTNTSTSIVTDRRAVADGSGVIVGDGSSASVRNTVTDFNSIKLGTDLGMAAVVGATKLATDAQASANSLAVSALGTTGNVVEELKGAYQSANEQAQAVASGNRTLAIVGMIVAGILAVGYLQSKVKK